MSDTTPSVPENEAEFEAYLQESLSDLGTHDPATLTPESISAHLYRKCVGPTLEDDTASVQGTFKVILNAETMAGFSEGKVEITRETHLKPSFMGLLAGAYALRICLGCRLFIRVLGGAQQWNGPSIGTLNAVGYTEGVTFYAVNHPPFIPILKDRLVISFFKGSVIHWKQNCIGVVSVLASRYWFFFLVNSLSFGYSLLVCASFLC